MKIICSAVRMIIVNFSKKCWFSKTLLLLLITGCSRSLKHADNTLENVSWNDTLEWPSETSPPNVSLETKTFTLEEAAASINAISSMEKLENLFPRMEYRIDTSQSNNALPCENSFNSIERAQLRSGGELNWTSVGKKDKNKIKLFGLVQGDFNSDTKAFILDYSNYLDTICGHGEGQKKFRLLSGLRIIFTVREWKLNVGIDGLEKIAAAKELNFSESSLKIKTIGWGQNDAAIDQLVSVLQQVSVKNYADASKALIDLMKIYKTATNIKPEVIPIL